MTDHANELRRCNQSERRKMTRDDVIRMAREAGFRAGHIELYGSDPMPFVAPCSATDCMPELVRFAALVASAEREACAEIADEYEYQLVAGSCARDIRARGDA